MNAANAIRERADRFVDEILNLIQRVQEEKRASALKVVTAMLTNMGQQPAPRERASLERRSPASRAVNAPRKKAEALATSTSGTRPSDAGRGLSQEAKPTKKSNTSPVTGPKQEARSRTRRPNVTATPSKKNIAEPVSITAPMGAGPSNETDVPASDREAVVLDTVRALVRATATEIAERCGLPNGSVYVVLRALTSRSQVARAETARGIEYSLVSTGDIRPFKRVKAASSSADAGEADREGSPGEALPGGEEASSGERAAAT